MGVGPVMADNLKVGGHLYMIPGSGPKSDRQARRQRMAVYLAWLLQPKDEREPRTKKDMADRLGVTFQTLLNYERDPDFSTEVRRQLGQAFRVDRLPALFESLYRTATEPENPRQVQAARTLLEWWGKPDLEAATDLADLTAEELEKIASGDGPTG